MQLTKGKRQRDRGRDKTEEEKRKQKHCYNRGNDTHQTYVNQSQKS
jgi:hypothetical protein